MYLRGNDLKRCLQYLDFSVEYSQRDSASYCKNYNTASIRTLDGKFRPPTFFLSYFGVRDFS